MSNFIGVRLLLFVTNSEPLSLAAIANLRSALPDFEEHRFSLRIIDVRDDVTFALRERVLATPTLLAPTHGRRLVGDLSNRPELIYFLQGLASDVPGTEGAG